MLVSNIRWPGLLGLTLACVACGQSTDDDDDTAGAGTGGAAGGRAASGGAFTGAVAGQSGGSGSGAASDAGRGGSAGSGDSAGSGGSTAGASAGGASAGRGAAGTGQGGNEAGRSGGGTTGEAGASEGGADSGALGAVNDVVATACSAAATCCTAGGFTPMLDTCAENYPKYQTGIAGLSAGYVTVDMAALARCKAAYDAGPDQCNLNAVVDACEGVFIGHQAVGEPCISGVDCDRSVDAMTCFITGTSGEESLGTCQKVPRAKLNEPCVSTCPTGENCSSTSYGFDTTDELADCFEDDGLYCEYLESGSVCYATLPNGAECGNASPYACGSRSHCDTTCVELSDLGEACGSCIHKYTCVDGTCADPEWANDSTCMGYPPGP